jgi:hypothetical protein
MLQVLSVNRVSCGKQVAANIMDFQPITNIMTFGMCMSPANPAVASATAALGVLTPMPCVPNTVAPWTPGSPTVELAGMPILTNTSTCMCAWGVISITTPGQLQTSAA